MGTTLSSSWYLGLLILQAGGLIEPASPCADKDTKVKVTVVAILATDQNHIVDPRLECIAREVKNRENTIALSLCAMRAVGYLGSAAGMGPLLAAVGVQPRQHELTGFSMGTTTCKAIAVGTRESFPLLDDKEAYVEAMQCGDEAGRVCLKVKAPRLGCITYKSICGKFLPIMTGYETADGQRLIIAVMVKPCPGD